MVISHSEKVRCTQEKLWALLLEKTEHPEKTIKEVTKSEILENYTDGFLRQMTAVGLNIKEKITVDTKNQEIKFVLVDNENFDGYFLNKIENKNGELILTYTQNWKPKNPEVQDLDLQFLPILKNAVLAMKKLAEAK